MDDLAWIFLDDPVPHSAGFNMAFDEVMLSLARAPMLRVYRWSEPAVTFGYFEKIVGVRAAWPGVATMRRWTGGGQVDHRSDCTYSVVLPAGADGHLPLARESYGWIHEKVADALRALGVDAQLADARAPVAGGPCFVKPVAADVMAGGQKIAGAAQKRTRLGMLHQGSIQGLCIPPGLPAALAHAFAAGRAIAPEPEWLARAARLAAEKYDTPGWLNRI